MSLQIGVLFTNVRLKLLLKFSMGRSVQFIMELIQRQIQSMPVILQFG